jgi:hypothetical protein
MARDGVSGAPCPSAFPYADIINTLAVEFNVSPCLVAALKFNETGLGHGPESEQVISFDGGHGLLQLTSSWPEDWQDPTANIRYAIEQYIIPAWNYWRNYVQGGDLVRGIAATYNSGLGGAEAGHAEGNFDLNTTNNYASRCFEAYHTLTEGGIPE